MTSSSDCCQKPTRVDVFANLRCPPGSTAHAVTGAVLPAFLVISACAPTSRPDPASSDEVLAITNVNVVDVESGRILEDKAVLIAGNTITTIGRTADIRLPPGAKLVDGSGKFLIPGLWDAHTHVVDFGPSALPLLVAHGVTGIRDMGTEHFARAVALRDSIVAGLVQAPRMKIASPIVENPRWLRWAQEMGEKAGTPWTLHERFGPSTPGEASRWVDSVAALGADHIKVRNWPDSEVSRALVARARELGLPVVGHAGVRFPGSGVTSYEHFVWPPIKGSRAVRDSLWTRWASHDVSFVPTLVVWSPRITAPDRLLMQLERGDFAGQGYVPAATRGRWRNELLNWKQEDPFDWTEIFDNGLRDVKELRQAGVSLMAGTDLGAPMIVPGLSLHDEIERLVSKLGLSPAEALQAATITPARAVGVLDSLGSVKVGNRADLVLLEGNPLQDIRNTRQIDAVIINGSLLALEDLRRMLAQTGM